MEKKRVYRAMIDLRSTDRSQLCDALRQIADELERGERPDFSRVRVSEAVKPKVMYEVYDERAGWFGRAVRAYMLLLARAASPVISVIRRIVRLFGSGRKR